MHSILCSMQCQSYSICLMDSVLTLSHWALIINPAHTQHSIGKVKLWTPLQVLSQIFNFALDINIYYLSVRLNWIIWILIFSYSLVASQLPLFADLASASTTNWMMVILNLNSYKIIIIVFSCLDFAQKIWSYENVWIVWSMSCLDNSRYDCCRSPCEDEPGRGEEDGGQGREVGPLPATLPRASPTHRYTGVPGNTYHLQHLHISSPLFG